MILCWRGAIFTFLYHKFNLRAIQPVPSGKNGGNTNSSHACTPTQLALQGFFNAIIQTEFKKYSRQIQMVFADW